MKTRGMSTTADTLWALLAVYDSAHQRSERSVSLSGNNLGQVVIPCGWEGNRRSGVALAIRQRLWWLIHLRAHGQKKGDEHPAYTLLMEYDMLCVYYPPQYARDLLGRNATGNHWTRNTRWVLHWLCAKCRLGEGRGWITPLCRGQPSLHPQMVCRIRANVRTAVGKNAVHWRPLTCTLLSLRFSTLTQGWNKPRFNFF